MANTARQRKYYDPYRNASYAYDGSAARVLEPEEEREVVLPRPRPRPQRRVDPRSEQLTRPTVEVREAGHVSLFAVTGFAAIAVMAVLILMSIVQLNAISDEVVSMESRMSTLLSEEETLLARYEMAYDLGAIESAVTAEGTMSRPQPGQIIYVDLTEPDSVVLYQQEDGNEGFFSVLEDWVGSILAYF